MGAVRGGIRSGEGATLEGASPDIISYTFKSNFDIYQTFYAIVDYYPQKADFYYGKTVFMSPVIMWIPRFVWPEKPRGIEYPSGVAIEKAAPGTMEFAAKAWPNIYEYYLDFGVLGTFFLSYILGMICKRMVRLYNKGSVYGLLTYALFMGFLIQLINRGDTSQLSTLLVFLLFPLLIYKKLIKTTSRFDKNKLCEGIAR